MKRNYCIYAFIDGNEIVYIGMTNQLNRRLRHHLNRANRRHSPKDIWIKKMLDHGIKPKMRILFSNLTEDQAHITERRLLKKHKPKFNVLIYSRSHKHTHPIIPKPAIQSPLTEYFHAFYQSYLPELFA